jgi:hypothetical protein
MPTPLDLSKSALGPPNRPPDIGFAGSEKERQAFFFFRQQTVPQLSGFFGDDFSGRLLLQAALYEPSVRHAILAIGSLHANHESYNGLIKQRHTMGYTNDFALNNYNRAINSLVEPLRKEGQQVIDVCLICSILFACLEVSRPQTHALFVFMISRRRKATTAPLSHTSKAV